MAQFSLNIPTNKVQSFLTAMAQNGFNKTIETMKLIDVQHQQMQTIPLHVNQQQHPYYDWDFYNNDLLID
ncbi:MAG TPA: hypothetical protein PLW32_08605 [Chitinophagaceae bacterium]|jgi:hypothetical protein|nr:hypothetical protein [Chitinophagaceae bacterium]HPH23928.1 hypothetical protein [Chitinophagaceae bacterium]